MHIWFYMHIIQKLIFQIPSSIKSQFDHLWPHRERCGIHTDTDKQSHLVTRLQKSHLRHITGAPRSKINQLYSILPDISAVFQSFLRW